MLLLPLTCRSYLCLLQVSLLSFRGRKVFSLHCLYSNTLTKLILTQIYCYGRDFRHVLTTTQMKSTHRYSNIRINISTFQHLNLQLATVRHALADLRYSSWYKFESLRKQWRMAHVVLAKLKTILSLYQRIIR